MGAAAIIAYDRLTAAQKKLVEHSRDDISDALTWKEWRDMSEACEKTLYCVDMGHLTADTMRGKEVPGGKKIGIALRFQEAGANLGLEFSENDLAPPAVKSPAETIKRPSSEKPDLKAAERDADLAAFHEAVMANDWAKAKRIGDPYGWSGDVNQGDE